MRTRHVKRAVALGAVLLALAATGAVGGAPSVAHASPTLPLPPPRGHWTSSGPGMQQLVAHGWEEQALNPQPLPPRQLPALQ
jgi:hypothetical protein